MTHIISLSGPWRLLPVDLFRQGFYPLDDAHWIEQHVPSHWQEHPLFERYSGKMVYRKRFTLEDKDLHAEAAGPHQRFWLRLNGVFYWSQAYFNSADLGRHEGYFTPQEHEVTAWVQQNNTLLVEVECPDEHNKLGKRLITGVFSHWDCIDPLTNPGGIWRSVELLRTGPARIKEVLLDTQRALPERADIRFRISLDSHATGDALLRWTITPKNFAGEVQVIEQRWRLEQGSHELGGVFAIRDPEQWWTHDMGHPSCYTVMLEVVLDGVVSDEQRVIFGIRTFEMRNWIPYLNGVRFFAKGNNYAPGDARIARMTRERYEQDIRAARDCHMNMLRVHAHVDGPNLYEAADEAGMLLWQDFPLQWIYRREVLPEAKRQARDMVRLLYNHPSIVVWCMHNEPLHVADLADERLLTKLRTYYSVFIWNWNRSVMDKQLKQVAEQEDQTRTVVRSSGEYAVPFVRKGTDSHFYYGWFSIYGPLRAWEAMISRFPDNIRFVTEFGAQSFPNLESCAKFMPTDIKKIDWDQLVARHQFLPSVMSHWLNWREATSLEALIEMTQDYQVSINRFYIDRLRHRKYRPTGGVLPFMFRDTGPAVQSSIIDYWGVPKRTYHAMRLAFSPQYAFSFISQDRYSVGEAAELPIFLVNDERQPAAVELIATLYAPGEQEIARVERPITLPADSEAVEVERLKLTPDRSGTYRLVLEWVCHGERLENEYVVIVE